MQVMMRQVHIYSIHYLEIIWFQTIFLSDERSDDVLWEQTRRSIHESNSRTQSMQVSTTISVAEHLKQNQQRQQLKDVNLKQLDKCDVIVKITMTWVLMTCPPSLLPNLVLEECAPKIKNPVSGVSSRFRQGLRSVRSKIKLSHLSWDGNSRRTSSSSLRLTSPDWSHQGQKLSLSYLHRLPRWCFIRPWSTISLLFPSRSNVEALAVLGLYRPHVYRPGSIVHLTSLSINLMNYLGWVCIPSRQQVSERSVLGHIHCLTILDTS